MRPSRTKTTGIRVGGYISDDILDRIRQATDIVGLVRESAPLKRAGSAFKALCPFHREKTPSFHVNPERQIFKCFGCGAAGDVFSFVMKTDGVEFVEAVRILAERAHITLPERSPDAPSGKEKKTLFDVNAWAAAMYHRRLVQSDAGKAMLEYLHNRGVTQETIERFELGSAPDEWDSLLKAAKRKKIPAAALQRAGLVSSSDQGDRTYDRFRGRIMFPIRDVRGRVIGFGARALSDDVEPKYLNSPETSLFSKGRVLYGLHEVRDELRHKRRAIVVEGYMDVIMLVQHGVSHAVGVLGTALTREHVRLLRRFVDEATLVFDADNAGRSSAQRSLDAFAAEELAARVAELPDGLDPDDFVRRRGAEAFLALTDNAPDGVRYKLDLALTAQDRGSSLAMANALDDVLATVALMPNSVARSIEIRKIVQITGLPERAVEDRFAHVMRRQRYEPSPAEQGQASRGGRDVERELLEALLTHPEAADGAREDVDLSWFRNDAVRTLVQRLFDMSSSALVTAEQLLAATQEDACRAVLEEIMGREPVASDDPTAWRRRLTDALAAREMAARSEELRSRLTDGPADENEEDALLADKLRADREAQRRRGALSRS